MPVHGRLRGRRAPVCVLLLALLLAAPLQARRGSALEHAPGFPPAPLTVSLELVARGIPGPVFVTHAGDGSGRLFVNEQVGRVRVVVDGEPLAEPFLDIRDLVRAELSEQGLLGLAFHPDYATNGLFFVAFTGRDDTNTVVRFQVSADDPNRADPTSGLVVLAIPDRFPEHHKGGMLAFGPDGYLYISTGDEGFTYDEVGNSQSLESLHGKILRIDVDSALPYAIPKDNPFARTPGSRAEIWSLGLRNPWRFSFDRLTGEMYVGDVGQDTWEEINVQPAGAGGYNFGWNLMEGNHCIAEVTPVCAALPEGLSSPVAEYDHTHGCAVIGGYVYRGSASPLLWGRYVFSDVCSGTLWMLDGDAASGWSIAELLGTDLFITSFGEDESGELLLLAFQSGAIYRVVGNDALQRTWERTDEPVAAGLIERTWLWGAPVSPRILEPYQDAPPRLRLVQYYDKSRMEVNDPTGDAETAWYVTNGLLVLELVTGRVQLGDDVFEERSPADVPVAGDPQSPETPTYASFGAVLHARPLHEGATVIRRLARDGSVSIDAGLERYGISGAHYVRAPGTAHTIAAPFWEFMQSEGMISERGAIDVAPLFPDPFYATGYPISEAYWVETLVDAIAHDVLVQCFQRRCLTYTPDNPPAWQVESGNVGQHYYAWRYGAGVRD